MSQTTVYARNELLGYEFGGSSYTPPAIWYLGLSTTSAGSSGSAATEPTDVNYARVGITNDTNHFVVPTAGSVTNSGSVAWAESSTGYGTIVQVNFWDDVTGGHIWHNVDITPRTISGSSIFQIPTGGLVISMS